MSTAKPLLRLRSQSSRITGTQPVAQAEKNGFYQKGKYERLKQQTDLKKLNFKPIELAYLTKIADEFSKAQNQFKGAWKEGVLDYLRDINTDLDTRNALRAAFKFVNNKEPHSALDTKIKKFATNTEENFIRTHADKTVIDFMVRLGAKASEKSSNSEFPDKHILLLGEHHVGLPQANGSFYNPPTAWLEENLDKLKAAGYDTLALEVPYEVNQEAWLKDGNKLWNHTAQEHISIVEKLRDEALAYFKRKTIEPKNDTGVALFEKKVNEWLLTKRDELARTKSMNLRAPHQPAQENTRERWLNLARKAHKAGFKVVTTDASRQITHEDERNLYFFQDLINQIKFKTDGLKLIEEYLIYKRGLTMTVRDISMAQRLEQALKSSQGNVIGLYGANHTKSTLANSRTSAQRILSNKNIPVVSVRMEFPGMLEDKNSTLLDKRLNIQPCERPSIISLSDMPFVQSQNFESFRDFQVDNHHFRINLKNNPTIGKQAPFDAVMLFAAPKVSKLAQSS